MKTVLSTTNLIAAAVIGGAFAAGFLTGPALAEEPQATEQFQFKFTYDPNELTSLPQAEELLSRLERRVRVHCGANDKRRMADRADLDECIEQTMKASIAKFGSDAVAQAYRARAAG